jgi:hypothetical protein
MDRFIRSENFTSMSFHLSFLMASLDELMRESFQGPSLVHGRFRGVEEVLLLHLYR